MDIFELMEKHDYNLVNEANRIKNILETYTYKDEYLHTLKLIYDFNYAVEKWNSNTLQSSYWEYLSEYNIKNLNNTNVYLYLEFINNVIYFSKDVWNNCHYLTKNKVYDIFTIIINLLSKFNKKMEKVNNRLIIVEQNNIVTEVIKDIKDEDYALALLQYQNVTIKDNAAEKNKLLTIISKNILPLIDKYRDIQYKNNKEFYKIADDLSCMLNNFHIRHNNKDGKDEKPFIHTLNNNKKIKYFDTIYNLILLLQQIENYKTIYADKVSELKQLL